MQRSKYGSETLLDCVGLRGGYSDRNEIMMTHHKATGHSRHIRGTSSKEILGAFFEGVFYHEVDHWRLSYLLTGCSRLAVCDTDSDSLIYYRVHTFSWMTKQLNNK